MKGPFKCYDDAKKAARPGLNIMCRDERYAPNRSWCVMSEYEVDQLYSSSVNRALSGWIIWEAVK